MSRPGQLGPYRVRSTWVRNERGLLLRAVDPSGAWVIIACPGEEDELAAAFVHRVTTSTHPQAIRNASLYAGTPWAAVDPDWPEVAAELIDVQLPPRKANRAMREPAGLPPVQRSATSPAGPSSASRFRLGPSRLAAVITFLGLTIAVLIGVGPIILRQNREIDRSTAPSSMTRYGPRPTAAPVRGARPKLPMLSRTWQSGDPVYRMALGGMPFAFDTPGDWGCMGRGSAAHVAWTCINEHSTDPTPSIMRSYAEPCSPCSESQQRRFADQIGATFYDNPKIFSRASRLDARTRASETHRTGAARAKSRWAHEYLLSRTMDTDHDRRPDRQLLAVVECSDRDRIPVEKMLGDLYDGSR